MFFGIRIQYILAKSQCAVGIMGAKQTAQLIPLCHNIPLDKVSVELSLDSSEQCVHIEANAKTQGHTGAVIVPCFLFFSQPYLFSVSVCHANPAIPLAYSSVDDGSSGMVNNVVLMPYTCVRTKGLGPLTDKQLQDLGLVAMLTAAKLTTHVCVNACVRTKLTGRHQMHAGVEMEAMVAASVAALTVYDMCKALDKGITIEHIRLEAKTGGKSGDYHRLPKP